MKFYAVSQSKPAIQKGRIGFMPFRKKASLIVAAILVATVLIALFVPQGSATIDLTVNFQVGEVMTYETAFAFQSFNFQPQSTDDPQSFTVTGVETIEVDDFNGKFYTLIHNVTNTQTLLGLPPKYSVQEKMSQTGYSTYLMNFGGVHMDMSSNNYVGNRSFLTQLLNVPEAEVGNVFYVPYPSTATFNVTGNLEITFGTPGNFTVPAGTFTAFKVDILGQNMKLINSTISFNLHYQHYMEYGTLRLIQSVGEVYALSPLGLEAYPFWTDSRVTLQSTLIQLSKP